MNTLSVLPAFDLSPYTHIVPSLERAQLSTADLLSLDAVQVAKRAQVPPAEVKKLADALVAAFHAPTHAHAAPPAPPLDLISTLDHRLDSALGGGVARGHVTEIVGESAAGKTQLLLTLLLAVQIAAPRAAKKPGSRPDAALYISTEAPLPTTRLTQILHRHPALARLSPARRPSLSNVHSTHIHDLEAQEHILRYQVPVAIEKHRVGLLVIDSIAANYRAEFDRGPRGKNSAEAWAQRSAQLAHTGNFLRSLAHKYNIAVVVANQVADRFPTTTTTAAEPAALALPSQSPPITHTRPGTPSPRTPQEPPRPHRGAGLLSTDDPLALDHQQRFFTGWGDEPRSESRLKTPSLGLAWTHQLSARVALLKHPIYDPTAPAPAHQERSLTGWNRACKVVFAAWCAEASTPFEIWEGGIKSVGAADESDAGRLQPR